MRHNSTEWATRPVTDFVYFATKGLPGLNFVEQTGDELAAYVRSTYPARRGWVYSKEPVVLALDEKYKITLPIEKRRPGLFDEHTQIVQLHLAVQQATGDVPNPAVGAPTPTDWLTHSKNNIPVVFPWLTELVFVQAKSVNLHLVRLENLLQAAAGSCVPSVTTLTNHTLLVAQPFGVAENGQNQWVAGANYRAAVGLENGAFIHRAGFESDDLLGFHLLGAPQLWRFFEKKLKVEAAEAPQLARFGEADWNHFTLKTEISGLDGAAGVAVGTDFSGAAGLYILISTAPSGDVFLKILNQISNLAAPLAEKLLPAAARFQLEVTAFDDRISATVGSEKLDVPRGEIREGFCALVVAGGSAVFENLHLGSLDMFAFGFRASRFKDFEGHIADFDLKIRAVPLLGGVDFSAVRAARQTEMTAAALPAAADVEREKAFVNVSADAGLLLTEEVEKSRISALRDTAGRAAALLFESPESLDVAAGEVKIEARHRRVESGTKPLQNLVAVAKLIQQFERFYENKGLPSGDIFTGFDLPGMNLLDKTAFELPARTLRRPPIIPPKKWQYLTMVEKLQVAEAENGDLELIVRRNANFDSSPAEPVFYLSYDAALRELSIFKCTPRGNGWLAHLVSRTHLNLEKDDPFNHKKGDFRLLLAPERKLVFYGDTTAHEVFWDLTPLEFLQNGNAEKLLVLAATPAGLLAAGTWRFDFKMERQRFSTTAPPDALSVYAAGARFEIEI